MIFTLIQDEKTEKLSILPIQSYEDYITIKVQKGVVFDSIIVGQYLISMIEKNGSIAIVTTHESFFFDPKLKNLVCFENKVTWGNLATLLKLDETNESILIKAKASEFLLPIVGAKPDDVVYGTIIDEHANHDLDVTFLRDFKVKKCYVTLQEKHITFKLKNNAHVEFNLNTL